MSSKTPLYRRTAGREIDRSEYADAVEENNKRYQKIRIIPNSGD
jgi:hypothetical protein